MCVIYGPRITKAARRCSGVGEGKGRRLQSRKEGERGPSCTAAHVLKFRRRGRTGSLEVLLKVLRPRTRAACLELGGLSCTQLCTVAPKKIWLLCKRGYSGVSASPGRFPATFPQFFLPVMYRAECSSVPPVPSMLHASAVLELLGAPPETQCGPVYEISRHAQRCKTGRVPLLFGSAASVPFLPRHRCTCARP
jgi:hypothetical protein